MKKITILVVDDSVVYRSQIKAALALCPQFEIVGAAANGKIAIEKLAQQPVDVMILDLEMPEMSGLETLQMLRQKNIKTQVIVFSSASKRGAEITFEALKLGAKDFIAKPGAESDDISTALSANPSERIRSLLEPKILGLFSFLEISTEGKFSQTQKSDVVPFKNVIWDLYKPKALVIASSTGGPAALEKIFSVFKGPLKTPIFIVQHMPPIFTTTLAERISKISGLKCVEGKDGEKVQNDTIYMAPGNYHLTIKKNGESTIIGLDQGPQLNSVRPAADPLFESAANIYGDRCMGLILTGMGYDGRIGAEKIKRAGGAIAIQSEDSCVVFGMPRAVKEAGAFDRVFHLDEIPFMLAEKLNGMARQTNPLKNVGSG